MQQPFCIKKKFNALVYEKTWPVCLVDARIERRAPDAKAKEDKMDDLSQIATPFL